jgi:hypothetical protein
MEEKLIENKKNEDIYLKKKYVLILNVVKMKIKKVITRTIYVRPNIKWYELLFLLL